ncbi:hypothetical protein R3P38DRAFT_2879935, partial [Favolaschia claudopus]
MATEAITKTEPPMPPKSRTPQKSEPETNKDGGDQPEDAPKDRPFASKTESNETQNSDEERPLQRESNSRSTVTPPSSSRAPPSPQYRHIEPVWRPAHPADHPDPNGGVPHWYQPPTGASDPHAPNVRLPGIASLLTEPYSPQTMPRIPPGYDERAQQPSPESGGWPPHPQSHPMSHPHAPHPHAHPHAHPHPHQHPHAAPMPPQQMPAPPEHYPPMVADLPIDDSRQRSPQPMPQRKRGRLPKETTDFLKAWLHNHAAHPYPSEIEKKQMCHATGLSMSQVSNWMINVIIFHRIFPTAASILLF